MGAQLYCVLEVEGGVGSGAEQGKLGRLVLRTIVITHTRGYVVVAGMAESQPQGHAGVWIRHAQRCSPCRYRLWSTSYVMAA